MTTSDPGREKLARWIDEARFEPVRLKPGYDMGETDDLLDRARMAVLAGEPIRPLLAERPTLVRRREGYQIESVDAFVSELLIALGESPLPPSSPSTGDGVIHEQPSLWQRIFGR